jgi:hypothetical protein
MGTSGYGSVFVQFLDLEGAVKVGGGWGSPCCWEGWREAGKGVLVFVSVGQLAQAGKGDLLLQVACG